MLKTRLGKIALIGLALVVVVLCASLCFSNWGLRATTERLGIQPSLGAVGEYIESQVAVGMPRVRVEQILSDAIPYVNYQPMSTAYVSDSRVASAYQMRLSFHWFPSLHTMMGVAHYDSEDRLLFMGDGEYFEIDDTP